MTPLLLSPSETPALHRLEMLRRQGHFLFHGDRRPGVTSALHPENWLTRVDPQCMRGIWITGIGFLPSLEPLVRGVYASPVVAAMAVLTQADDGTHPHRTEEFRDGTIAVHFGETLSNRGVLERVVQKAERLDHQEALDGYVVNVVHRRHFDAERLSHPAPGDYVATHPVPIDQRITLRAGDLRALLPLLADRPRLDVESVSCVPAFGGDFRFGGQLQFDGRTGQIRQRRLVPSDADARHCNQTVQLRGGRWLEGLTRRVLGRLQSFADPFTATRDLADLKEIATREASTGSFGRALRFIEANFTEPIGVADIAVAAEMSMSHLHAVFRRTMGCTPLVHVTRRRLQLAERMLAETSLSVGEISERCGFAEPTSLTRSLKRLKGITPSQIRQQSRVAARLS